MAPLNNANANRNLENVTDKLERLQCLYQDLLFGKPEIYSPYTCGQLLYRCTHVCGVCVHVRDPLQPACCHVLKHETITGAHALEAVVPDEQLIPYEVDAAFVGTFRHTES